jgi:hypothetical protein
MGDASRMGEAADYDPHEPSNEARIMKRHGLNDHCNHLFILLGTLGLSACDLPMKDIGDETDGSADTDTDDPSATTSAGTVADDGDPACDPGDTKPHDDGCNTCECTDEGLWACTLLGCPDTDDPGECVPGDTMPHDDGCNTCECIDDGTWACTEIDCGGGPGDGVMMCDDSAPMDPLNIESAVVQDDELVLDVSYSGGCADHTFGACWDGLFLESFPVQVHLAISHDDGDDACDAVVSEQIVFDLSPLAEAYESAYGSGSATIVINLDGWGGQLDYSF